MKYVIAVLLFGTTLMHKSASGEEDHVYQCPLTSKHDDTSYKQNGVIINFHPGSDYEEHPALNNERAACEAFKLGLKYGPNKHSRNEASKLPHWAHRYAEIVDKAPHEETRNGASEDPEWAKHYAVTIDLGPHDVTRDGASKDPTIAFLYAKNLDKGPHIVTRTGASMKPTFAVEYAREIDKVPHDITRTGASKTPATSLLYARDVDRAFSEETMDGACFEVTSQWCIEYKIIFDIDQ